MDLKFRAGRYSRSASIGHGSTRPHLFRLIGALDAHALYLVLAALTQTKTGIDVKVNVEKKVNVTRNRN